MTSLVKNIPIANFSLRGILPLLLLIGCIAALFFVPDLLKVSEHRPSDAVPYPSKAAAVRSQKQVAPAESGTTYRSPLDSLLESMSKTDSRAQKAELQLPAADPVSWELLRSEGAQNAVQNARAEAQAILSKLDERRSNSRHALFNLISVLDLVSGDASRLITAPEAAEQIETADLAVAAALQEDGVDRSVYQRWMKVSLAPALQSHRVDRIKFQQLRPFDPNLRLTMVLVSKIDPRPNTYDRVQSRLEMNGVVEGSDIQRLRLFRNGRFVQEVAFGLPDEEGLRHFSLARDVAYGVWTFKAYDGEDGQYEKSYRFFPVVERFPRDVFNYVLPFVDPYIPDPRLDKLFAVSERKGRFSDELQPFTTF
ncbi:MAG: hypothetical protein J5J00_05135 [Deltaproteobacteria bacterium]|nr:hypothetical protein [Deltaproteobacteria bacterium]